MRRDHDQEDEDEGRRTRKMLSQTSPTLNYAQRLPAIFEKSSFPNTVVLLGLVHSTGNSLLSVFELRCCRLTVHVPRSTACRDNARCYSLWDVCPPGYRTTQPTASQPALQRWGGQGRGQGDCSFPLRHFCPTS